MMINYYLIEYFFSYEYVIEITNYDGTKFIKHEAGMKTTVEKFENVKIINNEYLIQHNYVKGDVFKLIIYVRPANLFDKTVIAKRAINVRNTKLESLKINNENLKQAVAKFNPKKKPRKVKNNHDASLK